MRQPSCWQRVIRAGDIVTHRLRRIFAYEDVSHFDPRKIGLRVDSEMLELGQIGELMRFFRSLTDDGNRC